MIALSEIPLEAIASAASFGVAYASSGVVSAGKIAGSSATFPCFSAMEFPVEILELKEAPKLLAGAINGFQYLHIGSLIDSEVARNLPYASESLCQEFSLYAERIFSELSSVGIHTVAFDPGMNSVLGDEDALASMRRLLKKIAPSLLENRMTLLLPFTLPVREAETVSRMVQFLRDMMIPNLKVRLDLFPHEIPKDNMNPDRLAGSLLPEIKSVLFRYDADSGNVLVPDHVGIWVERLSYWGMRGPFLIAPASSDSGRFYHELESWASIVKALRGTSKTKI